MIRTLYGEIGSAKFSLNVKSFDPFSKEAEVIVDYK
jgi:hypothetical protein